MIKKELIKTKEKEKLDKYIRPTRDIVRINQYYTYRSMSDILYRNGIKYFYIDYASNNCTEYFPKKNNDENISKIKKLLKDGGLTLPYVRSPEVGLNCTLFRKYPQKLKSEPMTDELKNEIKNEFIEYLKVGAYHSHNYYEVELFTNDIKYRVSIPNWFVKINSIYPEIFSEYNFSDSCNYVVFTLKFDPEKPHVNEKIYVLSENQPRMAFDLLLQLINKNKMKEKNEAKEV